MRAIYYDAVGGPAWRELPAPAVEEPTDAVVRPWVTSFSDWDRVVLAGAVLTGPDGAGVGREAVGEVVAVGADVTAFRPGDVVAICNHVSCGSCKRCAGGQPLHCRTTATEAPAEFGMPFAAAHGGMLAELVRVPHADETLVAVPDGVDPAAAVSVGDDLTNAWRLVAPFLEAQPGADVLVMSGGTLGLYALDVARAYGAGSVVYVDRDPDRLALAERMGAETRTYDTFSNADQRFDLAVHSSDTPDALAQAIVAMAPDGSVENVSPFIEPVALPIFAMQMAGVRLRSSRPAVRLHADRVLEDVAAGRIDPLAVQTSAHPLECALDAPADAGFKPVFTQARAA